jgi:hypothetical protein
MGGRPCFVASRSLVKKLHVVRKEKKEDEIYKLLGEILSKE